MSIMSTVVKYKSAGLEAFVFVFLCLYSKHMRPLLVLVLIWYI